MKFDYLKLANIIKTRRYEAGISTRKLAEKIGVSHTEISRFENGLKPTFYFVPFVKLCKELDLDIIYLLETVGLLEKEQDKKFEVKITNGDEYYFEIMAKNKKEAAIIVAKFVIENGIVVIEPTQEFVIEVEELVEQSDDKFDIKEEKNGANCVNESCDCYCSICDKYEENRKNFSCKNCEYYCPYCDECTYWE